MMAPVEDHPLRYELANELHARPFPSITAPTTVVFIAIKRGDDAVARDRALDTAHLTQLLDRHGATHPKPGATHYYGKIGKHAIKWEQHTEFVTYTAFIDGVSDKPFDGSDFQIFPDTWLAEAPGQRMTSVSVRIVPWQDDEQVERDLTDWFVPESLAAARVLEDACTVAGDFRIDSSGHMRFAVFTGQNTGRRRVGRVVQRLCEIETYKTMSMLGFSRVRQLSGKIGEIENRMSQLMAQMTSKSAPPEETLKALLSIAAELETTATQASFRFGATGAYEAIVNQRIEALRETRFKGRQTFREFMMRRYEPAMRTVKSTETRLSALADRAMRTGDLLRTQVDVERSAQNQALLESMNRRADMQLRLQHTVEGLSVVAISYYAVSLAGYLLYPFADRLGVSPGVMTAAATLPVVALVWYMVRRIRRSVVRPKSGDQMQ